MSLFLGWLPWVTIGHRRLPQPRRGARRARSGGRNPGRGATVAAGATGTAWGTYAASSTITAGAAGCGRAKAPRATTAAVGVGSACHAGGQAAVAAAAA